MASGPITSWQIDEKTMETVTDFIFLGLQNHRRWSHEIKRCLLLGKKNNDKPRQHIKKQRHNFADKGPSSQSYGFSSSHVWMWELDCEESWALKNWCFWTVVLEKTLESPLNGKEIKPVHPKGNQSWIFIGRTDAEAKAPILWPPDAYSQWQHNIRYTIARVRGGAEKQEAICILHKCHKLRRNALVMFQINRS